MRLDLKTGPLRGPQRSEKGVSGVQSLRRNYEVAFKKRTFFYTFLPSWTPPKRGLRGLRAKVPISAPETSWTPLETLLRTPGDPLKTPFGPLKTQEQKVGSDAKNPTFGPPR